ncbi:MAG: 2-succinyl-5-enolpyruvyl-6-hydroxy-3-cyclohexene-1-carboxylic-acid synthase [Bacteroidetes bacterium]|nr:2-succinyl-5-enolpyruvyl-6-hydroxy-3-cyclohexene-1-carboxylic-acid synthase [Bacteroidota bacterium]
MNTTKKGIRLLAETCKRKGIRKVVFSPGSRSAPMVIAFSQIPEIECLVIPDERVAGYFALGLAQQLQQTVAVVCTSGTAVLNLSPAVCEAYYQNVPLLLLTADRPFGAVSKGENQAIMQEGIFGVHVVFDTSIDGDAEEENDLKELHQQVSNAIDETNNGYIGPVHVNVHLSEPLYKTTEEAFFFDWQEEHEISSTEFIPLKDLQRIKNGFQNIEKKMLIVGMREFDANFNAQIQKLSERKDVVVVYENISNVKLPEGVWNADAFITAMEEEAEIDLIPDVVVTFGKQIISKKLKQFLNEKPVVHWDVPPGSSIGRNWEMFGEMLDRIEPINETQFLNAIIDTNETESDFKKDWEQLSKCAEELSEKYFAKNDYNDLKVMETLVNSYPENSNIQYGNSTPIRYSNFFQHKNSLTVNSNRGTSGIDGCLSTAAGSAYGRKGITVCVLGDISFFYDSNALWNNYLSPDLRIIIINNNGGNIFRLLDGPSKVNAFEKFFETRHELTAKHLASMYGLPYYFCALQNELEETLKTFYEPSTHAKILEIKTDGLQGAEAYKQYFKFLNKGN